jgi:hypothetical protein
MWHSRFLLLAALCIASPSASADHVLINVTGRVLTQTTNWLGPGQVPVSVDASFIVDAKQPAYTEVMYVDHGTGIGARLETYRFRGVSIPWISVQADGREIWGRSGGLTGYFNGVNPSVYTAVGGFFAATAGENANGESYFINYDSHFAPLRSQPGITVDPLANLLLSQQAFTTIGGGFVGEWGKLTYGA